MAICLRTWSLLVASAVAVSAAALSGCGARTALGLSIDGTTAGGSAGTASGASMGGAIAGVVGVGGNGAQGPTSGGSSPSNGGDPNSGGGSHPGGANSGGGSSCTDACTLGDSRCLGVLLSTCVSAPDGCSEWTAGVACAVNQSCQISGTQLLCTCNPGTASIAGKCTVIDPPRPVAPLSTATVTSQTPSFHWALPATSDGAQVEIFRDRACTRAVASFKATGASAAPTLRLKKGLYFWRVRGTSGGKTGLSVSPVWEFFVGAQSAAVDASSGTIVDVNGDGLADVAVGANGVALSAVPSSTGTPGAAYLFLGTPAGLSAASAAIATPSGGMYSGFLNVVVASAGDVNGDGFADLLVAAYDCVTSTAGSAFIYMGGAAGVSMTPTALTIPGGGVRSCARSFASAGDVNGDGYADIIIGANNFGSSFGAAYVYLGGAGGVSTSPTTLSASGEKFGYAVASAGDIDGDGFGDAVVGGYSGFSGGLQTQGFYVFMGGPKGLSSAPTLLLVAAFTSALTSAGDVNGDGFSDVLVGTTANTINANGTAYLYLGGAGGLVSTPTVLGPPAGISNLYSFGRAVAGIGDLNGDGFADILVGAPPFAASTDVSAYLYLGDAAGLNTTGTGLNGDFTSVASAGDVNGDGFPEVLGGSYAVVGYNGSTVLNSTALVYQDSVSLFLGSASGYTTAKTLVLPTDLVQTFGVPLARAPRVKAGRPGPQHLPWQRSG